MTPRPLFSRRTSIAILVAVAAISVAALVPLPLDYDDDVIRFLPRDDPDVARLMEIGERFGGIHVALVGLQADDIFTADRLEYMRTLTLRLRELQPWVRNATGLTELSVLRKGTAEGVAAMIHEDVIPSEVPRAPETLAALRTKVLGLDYLVGSLVAWNGQGARLVVQLRDRHEGRKLSAKRAAEAIRDAVEAVPRPPGISIHYGGAPFIAEAAANGSQRDLVRLAPYVCGVIILLIVISLGSASAALLALGTVALGILWTLGLMGWLGQPRTLISSSLPVILVALGSAYAVHLLVWYLEHDADVPGMLREVGWPVGVAALTTMAGFASFLVMDLAPMREFGWQMAAGTAICAVLSLLLIPAVLTLRPIRARGEGRAGKMVDGWLVGLARVSQRRRWVVLAAALGVGIYFANHLRDIQTRMDTASFFETGSEPYVAEKFFADAFGGAIFLQLLLEGDIDDPRVLRQLADLEDRVAAVDGVTRVESVSRVVGLVNEGLGGGGFVPDSRGAVRQHLETAFETDGALALLVERKADGLGGRPRWPAALLQIAIGGFDTAVVRRVTADIRQVVAQHLPKRVAEVPNGPAHRQAVMADAAERLHLVTGLDQATVDNLLKRLQPDRAALVRSVRSVLDTDIAEEEMVEVREGTDLGALSQRLADQLMERHLDRTTFLATIRSVASTAELKSPQRLDKGAGYIYARLEKVTRSLMTGGVDGALVGLLQSSSAAVRARTRAILSELAGPRWRVPAASAPGAPASEPLRAEVSGYPIVQEAMGRSVYRNQGMSILVSLPLVFLILVLLFRNLWQGLVGLIPTGLTLLVVFGLMGIMGDRLPMDLTASMLASIALGVGIDYSIHFVWRYRVHGVGGAMRTTGRAIAINAAEITAGFIVLASATIVPMSRFGILVAVTLLVAAVATLLILPALLK